MTERDSFSEENQRDPGRGRGSRRRRGEGRGPRKERVLHTRVSEQLSEDIRQLADDLRVPVSNLVRNVLEEVFTVVETVSEDVGEFFEDVVEEAEGVRERIRNQQRAARSAGARGRRGRRSSSESAPDVEAELRRDEAAESRGGRREPPVAEDVLGWQPLVLNQPISCARCSRALDRGANALLGIGRDGRPGGVICPACGVLD